MNFVDLFIGDSLDLIRTAHLRDAAPFFFVACWLVILLIPLSGIDRRDGVTFFTYIVYMVAAGVTLFLAIPNAVIPSENAALKHIAVIAGLCPLVAVRWLLSKRDRLHG